MPIKPEHTTYSVLDFLRWQKDGTLDLTPPFQRRSVWRPALKSSLIDSILRGYPVPALFLQDRSDTTKFSRELVVVDGQQRLRTVLAFVDVDCLDDATDLDRFTIMGLHDKDHAGDGFGDLTEDERQQILDFRFGVYTVTASVSDAELLEIFRRMNSYGSKLNAQELRHAQFNGVFKQVAYQLAADFFDYWLAWKTLNRQQIAEMKDAEFTSELILLALNGTEATTTKQMDRVYKDYDDRFEAEERCADRTRAMMKMLDSVYRGPTPVPRLTKRMWVYSLFDAIQRVRFGGPIDSTLAGHKLSISKIRSVAVRVNEQIEEEGLPENVAQATRGAANDRQSREDRAGHIMRLLEE